MFRLMQARRVVQVAAAFLRGKGVVVAVVQVDRRVPVVRDVRLLLVPPVKVEAATEVAPPDQLTPAILVARVETTTHLLEAVPLMAATVQMVVVVVVAALAEVAGELATAATAARGLSGTAHMAQVVAVGAVVAIIRVVPSVAAAMEHYTAAVVAEVATAPWGAMVVQG